MNISPEQLAAYYQEAWELIPKDILSDGLQINVTVYSNKDTHGVTLIVSFGSVFDPIYKFIRIPETKEERVSRLKNQTISFLPQEWDNEISCLAEIINENNPDKNPLKIVRSGAEFITPSEDLDLAIDGLHHSILGLHLPAQSILHPEPAAPADGGQSVLLKIPELPQEISRHP